MRERPAQAAAAPCAVGCEPLPGSLLGGLGGAHVPASGAAGGWPEGVNSFGSLGVWLAWGFLNGAFSVLGEFLEPLMGPGRSPQEWSSKHRSLLPLQVGASCKVWSLKRVDWSEVSFNAELVQDAWYFCTAVAINWLGGYGAFPTSPCPVRKAGGCVEVERLLRGEIVGFLVRDSESCARVSPPDVMHEVDAAVINYSGEEVLPMRPLTVEQMEPGLPPAGAGGRVSAFDLVDPGTRMFLSDPSLSFLPMEDVEEGPCQAAVHVEAGSRASVARLLVERGVCKPLRRCEVGQFQGRPVLNELFGVPKPKLLSDGRPILRTIINLIPSNRTQRVIGGHINCLPSITKWQSIILGDGETLLAYQCDMACAFYLFALPEVWLPWFCLNFDLSGRELGLPSDERYTIACCTLPMGWKSAVGIMQCLSRRVLLESRLPDSHEVRKDRMVPPWLAECWRRGGEHGWWQVYLDNFISCEVIHESEPSGDGRLFYDKAHSGWESFGILCSADKNVEAAGVAHELGAEIDGELGKISGGTARLWKTVVCSLAVALLSKRLTPKRIQVLGGRWAFLAQFRRPFAVFSELWRAAMPGCSLAARRRAGLELVMAVMLSPLASCNLRRGLRSEEQFVCQED